MASPDAISIIRELGVCKSGESGPLALLGAANHAAPYTSCCAKTRQYETNWLAHVSAHVLHIASGRGSGSESNAGTAATLHDPCDLGYLHAGGDSRQAYSPHRGSLADCWKWRIEAVYSTKGAISPPRPGLNLEIVVGNLC